MYTYKRIVRNIIFNPSQSSYFAHGYMVLSIVIQHL